MKQKSGTALKVGDVVQHAYTPPGPFPDRPRKLGSMMGVVTKVIVGGGSGGAHKGRRGNAVRVRWASGSEARHDAHMIVKIEETP